MKVSVRFACTMAVISLIMIASIILTFEAVVMPWHEDAMIRESQSVAHFLRDASPYLDDAELQHLCEHLVLENPDLSYVLVLDGEGKALMHSDPKRVGMVFDDTGTLAAARNGETVEQIYVRDSGNESSPYHGERIFDIVLPRVDGERNTTEGAVNVGLSMNRLDRVKWQYRLLIGAIGVIILGSMLLLTLNFFSHVYLPIELLVTATRKFRDDRAPARIPAGGDDEFNELVREFNGMSERLAQLISDLSRRERDLQEYVNHLLTFNAKLSPDGSVLIMKTATPRPEGMRGGHLVGLRLWEEACWELPAEARDRLRDRILQAASGEAVQYEEALFTGRGRTVLDIGLRPVREPAGPVEYIVAEVRDITTGRLAEEALRESEMKFRVLADTSPIPICLYQGDSFVYVNGAFSEMTGYSQGELLSMNYWDWAHPDARDRVREIGLARQRREQVQARYEVRMLTKGGETRWALINAGAIEYDGRPASIATLVDITDRKRSEDLAKSSLKEKEVLLREIHHRVKNNLQIISSMLNLQSSSIADEAATRAYRESQDRIRSMALIHEKLYQSKDLASIDFADYLRSLTGYLFQTYLGNSGRVRLDLKVEQVSLAIDVAIPCGLIVNELITNSLKHAFPGDRRGLLIVRLGILPDRRVELTVGDDGVGLPAGFDIDNARTLGLQLVSALVAQMDASLEITGDQGVTFRIVFGGPRDQT